MNAQKTLIIAILMQPVQTILVLLIVNVKQGFREMEFPVQVRDLIYLVCIASLSFSLLFVNYCFFISRY